MSKHMKTAVALNLLAVLALAGCDEHGEGPDEEACEHLQQGPSTAITASIDSPPPVNEPHHRYDVTLPAANGQFEGAVQYAVARAADYYVYFTRDLALQVADVGGNAVTISEKVASVPECTDVRARYRVPMQVGTYTFRLGPTPEDRVSLTIEPVDD
jgi:hypothetical protein